MSKAFLSHSSSDKTRYIRVIADKLGPARCVFDEMTFEAGCKSLAEIFRTLETSDLFVFFISRASLRSKWVKKELVRANERYKAEQLKQIFPIIIEPGIRHDDKEIPEWLRGYNLKFVELPSIALRKIEAQLRIIGWEKHPILKKREMLFVGRNEVIAEVETRFDNIDMATPVCLVASGMKYVGRSRALQEGLVKASVTTEYYRAESLDLEGHESIEDFIFKLKQLEICVAPNLKGLIGKSLDEKLDILTSMVSELVSNDEILFIRDSGCLVQGNREISSWFKKLLERFGAAKRPVFCIASVFRPSGSLLTNGQMFHVEVPVLSPTERIGLFRRYLELIDSPLDPTEISFFREVLFGYPNQVFFAADLIRADGLPHVRKNMDLIVRYSTDKASYILSEYSRDPDRLAALFGLCQFDAISSEIYDKVFSDFPDRESYLEDFYFSSLVEYVDGTWETFKLNDIVKDALRRSGVVLDRRIEDRLNQHMVQFLATYETEEKDFSDMSFSIQRALKEGKPINQQYVIPSQYLKAIVSLYDQEQKYAEVVKLSDTITANQKYIDQQILYEIYYYLCQSLARLKDDRLFRELPNLRDDVERAFIKGFYFRLTSQFENALNEFKFVLSRKPNHSRAKREAVQVFLSTEEFGSALSLAKENYETNKTNPFQIHAYIVCLIHTWTKDTQLIEQLILELKNSSQLKAKQLYYQAEGEFLAFSRKDVAGSLRILNQGLKEDGSMLYVKLLKLKVLEFGKLHAEAKSLIEELGAGISRNSIHYNVFKIREALHFAAIGDKKTAKNIVEMQLINFPPASKLRVLSQIESAK